MANAAPLTLSNMLLFGFNSYCVVRIHLALVLTVVWYSGMAVIGEIRSFNANIECVGGYKSGTSDDSEW